MTTLNSSQAKRIWRTAIKKAWNDRCAYCGNPPIDDKSLTIDHVTLHAFDVMLTKVAINGCLGLGCKIFTL